MEIVRIIIEIVAALARAVGGALASGDWGVLDRPVREVLPLELQVTAARARAEAEAEAKLGPRP
jgi:hypothetical protein